MQELIDQLTSKYGVSAEQATGIIDTIKNYMTTNVTTISAQQTTSAPAGKEESMFEKATEFVEEHVPGGMKEKAEELLGGMGDKLKGLFS